MNRPNQPLRNSNLKIATIDLVLMALFASMGLATKNLLYPILGPLIGAAYIPTGAVTGGLYMMWPVMAFGLIRKPGAATMVSLIQACISLVMPFGNFGVLSFVIYLGPGLAIDAFFLLTRHRACCLGCCMGASALANVVGTVLVGATVLFLPWIVLTFLAVIAAISGCIGGFIANLLLVRTAKLGIGGKKIG
ncbi:MAG: ECF transporter S component [Candidatus Bathyarchaeota archaeon]|nr:ECF transporter S component [Candidatus Bathyarchaeota archaeon]